jgi:hypothetical protein
MLRVRAALLTGLVTLAVVGGGIGGWQALADRERASEIASATCADGRFERIAIYLHNDVSSAETQRLLEDLTRIPGVQDLTAVSKEEAFEEFKRLHEDEPEFWENLPVDALPARIDVTVTDGDQDTGAHVVATARSHPATDEVHGHVAGRERDCPLASGPGPRDERRPRPTTEEVVIASGTEAGEEWILAGYRATTSSNRDDPGDHLCFGFDWGDEPDINCMSEGAAPMKGFDYGYRYGVPYSGPRAVFIGSISDRVDHVDLRLDRERVLLRADIFEPPEELQLDFRFFVGFAPVDRDVDVVVVDENGRDLAHEFWEALAVLEVTKSGLGAGDVIGYRSEQIAFCETNDDCREPRPTWIDCGTECIARLDGARITLKAFPAEGSEFVGWRGDCTGTGICELVVDRDLDVEATFDER